MKINLIYDHIPNSEEWSTPYGIKEQLILRGHEVLSFKLDKKFLRQSFENLKSFSKDVDAIFLLNAGQLNVEEFWNHDYLGNKILIYEACDEPQTFNFNRSKAKNSDIVLTPDLRCHNIYKENSINSFWWTHFCDTSIFKYKTEHKNNKCVTSCGDRGEITNILQKELGDLFYNTRQFQGKEQGIFLGSNSMVFQKSRWGEVTRRIFEAAGCGSMVITDRIHPNTGIYELFREDRDMIFYSTPDECVNKIKFYLKNDKARDIIAKNGYKRIQEHGTIEKRIIKLEKIIKEL